MTIRNLPALRSNYGNLRKQALGVCLHHKAACATNDTTAAQWRVPGAQTSSNYGVYESDVACFVPEEFVAYCQGSLQFPNANQEYISIEISNAASIKAATYAETLKKGDELGWPVSDLSLKTAIELVADIFKRNNLGPCVPGENLKWHNLFKATTCPGPYLQSKMQYIADEVNKLIAGPKPTGTLYGVVRQVIALSDKARAEQYAKELNSKGEKDAYYKVMEVK